MDSYKNKLLKNCSKCPAECVSTKKIKDFNSNINIAYAPKDCTLIAKDEDELRLRIWSFMRPPKISSPTPIISPCRLEKVRNLLDEKQDLKLTKLDCIGMPEQCMQLVEESKLDRLEREASIKTSSCRKVFRSSQQHQRMFHPCPEAAKENLCNKNKSSQESAPKLQCNDNDY